VARASGSYEGEGWRISWPAQDVGLQERGKRSPSVRKGGYRIVPEANLTNDDAPSHRVYVDRAEIGAAWPKRSKEGREYLSVKVDGPHFGAPAALAKRTNGQLSRQAGADVKRATKASCESRSALGEAISAKRAHAVALTAIAPITAMTCCQM
jgi:uncharacterized protein (DUF736 family)